MPTYTLTIDFTSITLPDSWMSFENNLGNLGSDATAYATPTDVMVGIGTFYITAYSGTYTITNSGQIFTITLNLTNDPVSEVTGQLVAVILQDADSKQFTYAWQQGIPETKPCQTCQSITLIDCDSIELNIELVDDDYIVTIHDNQSGVDYTQRVQWTLGVGTWNGTNTAGIFNPYTIYTITLTDTAGTPVSWSVGSNEYSCATMTFVKSIDTNPI